MRCRIVSARLSQSVSTNSSLTKSKIATTGNGMPLNVGEEPLNDDGSEARRQKRLRSSGQKPGVIL
jgi:hypothetical protein